MKFISQYFPELSEIQVKQLEKALELYPEWNEKINVISRKDIENLESLEEIDLSKYPVFIQVKDGTIYKINKLCRKNINKDSKSTIRYFYKTSVFNEDEFIDAVKNYDQKLFESVQEPHSINELWKSSFYKMVVQDVENGNQLIFYGKDGEINRDYSTNGICMCYRYVKFNIRTNRYVLSNEKYYSMKPSNYNKKKFILLAYYES